MEILLEATDIFDLDISRKIEENMILVGDQLEKEPEYQLTVSFHVGLLDDARMDDIDVKISEREKNETKKDRINNLLRFQLTSIDNSLSQHGFNISYMSIRGEFLEAQNIIRVQLEKQETTHNSHDTKRKSKSPMKIRSIMPSLPYIQDVTGKFASKRLNEIYSEIRTAIHDKKILSEALEIDSTEDENILFQAFVKQYHGLWLNTRENEKALFEKLYGKIERALDNRIELMQASDKNES
ncbi:hypothetical protein BBD42_26965 [Paenibacillus sp. BIHB 4019]|uniref:Uncharacterized protein n=1 Tax=Paenibacillus sp. BIHB 4019 TaxID=1870819 RepID=A0A1B2DPT7_9BACL|nr:hypothetical protein [Paenibacillus sp. BIHB 4019]ANY69725.1 hypothetical protein BBD42_26965 [Paenibacillus sp. BIHB 4019]